MSWFWARGLPNICLSSVYCRAAAKQNSAAPRTPHDIPYLALFRQLNGPERRSILLLTWYTEIKQQQATQPMPVSQVSLFTSNALDHIKSKQPWKYRVHKVYNLNSLKNNWLWSYKLCEKDALNIEWNSNYEVKDMRGHHQIIFPSCLWKFCICFLTELMAILHFMNSSSQKIETEQKVFIFPSMDCRCFKTSHYIL